MSYTSGNRAALGIARCSINQSRSASWLTIYQVTLIRASTYLFGLVADAIAVCVLVEELFALTAVYYFISHNIRCFCFFHAHTSRNTRQTSRKGRNRVQNARTRRSMLFYSFLSPFFGTYLSVLSSNS